MPKAVNFKDVSISLGMNPVTEDVLVTTDEAAVKRALYNIIMTRKGERFFKPDLGSNIANLLFEPLDAATASLIKEEIEYVIIKYGSEALYVLTLMLTMSVMVLRLLLPLRSLVSKLTSRSERWISS